MFGLGMPEILMILAIALIVIGPKKLPDLAKTLGRAMGEFKRSAQDFKHSIDVETSVKDIKDAATDDTDLSEFIKNDETKDKKTDSGEDSDSDVFDKKEDSKQADEKPDGDVGIPGHDGDDSADADDSADKKSKNNRSD